MTDQAVPTDDSIFNARAALEAALADPAILPDLLGDIIMLLGRALPDEHPTARRQRSEDILQSTMTAALQSAAQYDPDRPAYPWLLRIALNEIRQARRRRKVEKAHITPVGELPQVQTYQQGSARPLSETEMFDLVQPASAPARPLPPLEQLLRLVSADDAGLLRLVYDDELDGAKLAAQLGISEGAARTRLSRARARLRTAYAAVTASTELS